MTCECRPTTFSDGPLFRRAELVRPQGTGGRFAARCGGPAGAGLRALDTLPSGVKAVTDDGERIECADVEEAGHGLRLYDAGGGLVGYVPYGELRYVTRWRTPVASSSIASVGYDDAEGFLELAFQSGGVYRYSDVPRDVYEGMLGADSHGRYFHEHVRGRFDYRRVT